MHKLVIGLLVLGMAHHGFCQEPAPVPGESCQSKSEPRRPSLLPPGNAQVLLQVQVLEIPRTKLQELGFDFPPTLGSAQCQSFKDLPEAMRTKGVGRVLAAPTMVTQNNRPASFQCGGQARVAVPHSGGRWSIEEKFYGTRVDFVPSVSADRRIHLTCHIEVSHLDSAQGVAVAGETAPVLGALQVDTEGDYKSGQTVVLGGLLTRRGSPAAVGAAPKLAAKPEGKQCGEEIQTLVLVTSEIVEPRPTENAAGTRSRRSP